MDKVEKLEKRIDELENKLNQKQNKTPNWKILSKSVLTEWDEDYRTAFEQQYSFSEGHKFERFDIKKLINGIPNNAKTPQKLKYWEGVYNDLKQTLGDRYGKQWPDLCYIMEMAVRFYQNDAMRHILEKGEYPSLGGRKQQINGKEVIKYWKKYSNNPDFIHNNGRYKGKPKKREIQEIIADKIGIPSYQENRTRRINDIIKAYMK
jgi:hypothetical protein